jgi:sugar-specific transcriptional regulator TrmB
MKDLTHQLENSLGLTDTEAVIYLASLPHPSVSVQQVVNLTGIKRTTVYHALDTLMYKGLAAKKHTAGKAAFSMIAPKYLQYALEAEKQKIHDQQEELKKIIPELELLKKDTLFNTQVQHYQGVTGVKAVFEEALYCKSRRWYTITPGTIFMRSYGQDFRRYVNEKRRQRKITTYGLWESARAKRHHDDPVEREVRVMPHAMEKRFKSKIMIFDNKIGLINSTADAGAILITSEEIHAVFKAIFDTIWTMSRPIVVK